MTYPLQIGMVQLRSLLMGWRDRLKAAMEGAGYSMKRLSLKAELGESYVRDILNRGREPSIENLNKLANILSVSASWLIQGEEEVRLQVPVVGFASAGEGWTPFDASSLGDTVDFQLNGPDFIAIEVRGDSMAPVFRNRDFLFCRRETAAHVDNYIGLECVLRTIEGENFVKILARGSRPGRYNLRSYNPVFADVEDVRIQWLAPIVWIKRSGT